jgi:hypothetical protein
MQTASCSNARRTDHLCQSVGRFTRGNAMAITALARIGLPELRIKARLTARLTRPSRDADAITTNLPLRVSVGALIPLLSINPMMSVCL